MSEDLKNIYSLNLKNQIKVMIMIPRIILILIIAEFLKLIKNKCKRRKKKQKKRKINKWVYKILIVYDSYKNIIKIINYIINKIF